ncbi:MerR family DNA-binding transcriptional regulator [Streptomyces sp. NPDC005426]|uniref:MerR family DNA-binding transcriptional regulator n=1 Tax=Streptomyces sp. NPDC005426 TaxID=3155344 RepID=UPI0033A376D2
MLSISDFSEMCDLPPQTLRYYHAAGLLVPADVDERTGYRSYTATAMSGRRPRPHADQPRPVRDDGGRRRSRSQAVTVPGDAVRAVRSAHGQRCHV